MSSRTPAPRTPASRKRRLVRLALQTCFAGAVIAAACSSQPDEAAPSPTEPAVTESVPSTDAPTTSAATPTTEATPTTDAPVTTTDDGIAFTGFAADVQPILESSCASCHTGAGPGTSHFPMDTAALVQDAAFEIGAATNVGYMPPWPAADGDVAFHDDRRLTAAQIETIRAWVEAGAPLDVDPTTPLVATAQTVTPIERDVVMAGQPYLGSTAKRDDYRCRIFDPQLTEPGFLQGYAIEADQTAVVHHALLFRADASTRQAAEQADAADPAIGWECGGLAGFAGGTGDVDQILSWAPGQDPTRLPADTGIPLAAGDFFVAQIHYHYDEATNGLPPDSSRIVLDLASDEVIAAAGGSLDPIELTLYLGPAEIPCSTGETGPLCDRATMQAQLIETWGPAMGRIADFLMLQCGATLDDFAGMTNGIASSTCDLPATPGRIVSVWGHMHEIGASFRMTLNPDTPEERVLLDIPTWSFDWQLDYRPIEAIVLDSDDVIRIECSWDRSLMDDDLEPRYVMWAEGTEDEMCYSQIVTRPAPGA
jgi:hypothetical protein